MREFEFEWDMDKAAINRKKHNIRLEEATEIFLDPLKESEPNSISER